MTVNVISGFCHLSGQGGKAVGACLTLLHKMCDSGMIAHVISLDAAIAACKKGAVAADLDIASQNA